ncbi:MAG TPA: hypothetical protein VKR83_06840 [Ktedonobacteraceae bacterium]|nr:hypothetical protein [Ktedonobacteraceae bacterium]
MKAMREVSHPFLPWERPQWWRREFGLRVRDELLARLFKEQSTSKAGGGVLGRFARFCLVGTSNAVIDFGGQSVGAGRLPHAGDRAEAFLQHGGRRAGRNVLKLGAILGAMALSFFGRRLSPDPPAKARGLSSSSEEKARA